MKKKTPKIIPWSKPKFFGEEKKLVVKAIDSSWISGICGGQPGGRRSGIQASNVLFRTAFPG